VAQRISQFTITVRDYDEALAFYVEKLGFELLEDTDLGGGKRWVRVRPAGDDGAGILLARAAREDEVASVGRQTGGRVFVFIETTDFWRDHGEMIARGVRFVRPPSEEPYGTVAVFEDLYGNRFDLIEPRQTRLPRSDRLTFRWWTADDLDLAMELWGDPRVTALIDARGALARSDVEARLREEIAAAERSGVQYWPIFSTETGELVGCAGLRPRDGEERVFELGFHLCARSWGRGLATEAAHAVARFAIERLGAQALFAGHNPENVASARVLAKLGFRHTHDELYPPTGLLHPSYLLRRGELTSR
jgi:RimJ/RimL family protein N-acetyltransferase/predicted enzyme related to lactoylglutathione lyase